jgi:hypothetical protein
MLGTSPTLKLSTPYLGPLRFQSTDREEELNRVKRQILITSIHVNPSNELTAAV